MTSDEHNRTLGIIFGILGTILMVFLSIILIQTWKEREANHSLLRETFAHPELLIGLITGLLLCMTALGIIKKRRWARPFALILSAPLVVLYPLGTLLSVYAWRFFHSDGAKQLYPSFYVETESKRRR